MNQDVIKGKWKEIKGEIQKQWGKLTNDELEQTKGDMTAVNGLIQQKYGHAKDEVSKSLNDLTGKYAQRPTEQVKEKLQSDNNKPY